MRSPKLNELKKKLLLSGGVPQLKKLKQLLLRVPDKFKNNLKKLQNDDVILITEWLFSCVYCIFILGRS